MIGSSIDYRTSESVILYKLVMQSVPFLTLSSCYKTQSNLAYSGLNTLAIILNPLQIDPRRKWKSIWRWYTDELLDDFFYRDGVKRPGTTLEEFVY